VALRGSGLDVCRAVRLPVEFGVLRPQGAETLDTPDVQPHVIYLCILALAAFQFVIAYSHIDGTAMFARMLFVALAEAGLALKSGVVQQ
jgi:hypothetical protein